SLVRQLLYGKRFFREEFDVDSHILWLPDVFGYSAALPQILKKSGVDWFVTSKISWNDTNKMPYDTFLWKGIDGTAINTYFLTAQDKKRDGEPVNFTTYNGLMTPSQIAGTYDRYQQKELTEETLITYGYGDGGGGPTDGHLEFAKRLSHGIPGTPKVRLDFAGNFLKRLEEKINGSPYLPVWQGELYLECHRGTYTTQSKNKKNNRRSEELYLNTERLCSMTDILMDKAFPQKALRHGWEMILTNQFHDIIPGSSVREVYEQSDIDYAQIRDIAEHELRSAVYDISRKIDKRAGYVVFNPNPVIGSGNVKKDGVCVYVGNIPANGYSCVREEDIRRVNSITVTDDLCMNGRYILKFNEKMLLTSIYDKKNGREVLSAGGVGNELRVYADYPDRLDAWEWNDFSMDVYTVIDDVSSVEKVCDGVRAGLKITRRFMNSSVTQIVWLYEYSDRIDFDTEIDWHESHQALKAAFAVDINATRATYEIQYGTIERPTHKNTSWDRAKFEVCGHRFADLSEGGYGVSLLNDCKYGYDIHDGVMMLSLLRSPTYPDPEADRGKTGCTYSLYPHAGSADIPRLYSEAYELNNPMFMYPAKADTGSLPESFSMVDTGRENILCEVIKKAEDSDALIFRFFENSNTKTRAEIRFGFDIRCAELCDMSENPIKELEINGRSVTLDFGAFEIHTLKIEKKR
ncbi:MAG: alpha-mannosidase, partial [Eubacteriales bacterium]